MLFDAVRRLSSPSTALQSSQEHLEFHSNRLSTYRLPTEEIESYLFVKRPAGSTPMDVDALSTKGKGLGKAGANGWNRDLKEKGKSSFTHCGGRFIGLHTDWDYWHNPKKPSPEAQAKRSSKAKRKVVIGSSSSNQGKGKPGKRLGVQSLDQAWPVEEQVPKEELVSVIFFLKKTRESEDLPKTVVRRKKNDGNDQLTSKMSTAFSRT